MENGLVGYRHNVGQSIYHVIWCPKYRFNMFRKPGTAGECEAVLRGIAARHGLRVFGLLWSPGTCFRSVGDADLETVKAYVRNQSDVHQRTLAEYTTGYPGL